MIALNRQELQQLKKDILNTSHSNKPKDKRWKVAFDEYNRDHGGKPLNLNCRVCYPKVLYYLLKKHYQRE